MKITKIEKKINKSAEIDKNRQKRLEAEQIEKNE